MIKTFRQSSLSVEIYRLTVSDVFEDPTGTPPRFAFVEGGEPAVSDWEEGAYIGTWSGSSVVVRTPSVAGEDSDPAPDKALPNGCYDVWVEMTGVLGEKPKRKLNNLRLIIY